MNRQTNRLDVARLATIAHDLRNPLTAVRVSAQVMRLKARRTTARPDPWLEQGLSLIEDASTRMDQLIDEIVALAWGGTGDQLVLDRRPTDLVELVARSIADARTSGAGHRVRLELAEPPVVGRWDGVRLRRVVDNLLGNALKYSPPEREVVVRVARARSPAGERALLEVQDLGQGIPAADLPHVFDPFRRGSNVGCVEGYGLGLASARQIVEAHGGSIEVASLEGQGTTFVVRLPLAE